MVATNDAKDAFPAFGGDETASFPEQTDFPAFDGPQHPSGEFCEGLEKAKQEVNTINAKERRSRSDHPAKLSEPPHARDDSPAAKGKKRGSGIKGLFKKGTKDEP